MKPQLEFVGLKKAAVLAAGIEQVAKSGELRAEVEADFGGGG